MRDHFGAGGWGGRGGEREREDDTMGIIILSGDRVNRYGVKKKKPGCKESEIFFLLKTPRIVQDSKEQAFSASYGVSLSPPVGYNYR